MSSHAVAVKRLLDTSKQGDSTAFLNEALHRLIIGQDDAINDIVSIYQMYVTGLCAPGRPIANFLFLGPTGTGKTRTVEATAEALVDNPNAVVKIDCAEFQHSHEIAKLLGSPPGYLGHRETKALLSQENLDEHHAADSKISFLLFDEIEKASDALWNLLLGILDKAVLTLGDNKRTDFSKAMIFMTSNLGAAEMSQVGSQGMGFWGGEIDPTVAQKKIYKSGIGAAKRKFTPEFMNRIDKCVVFQQLGEAELRKILDLELAKVQARVLDSRNGAFIIILSQRAKDFLLSEGTDRKYGARHLKRAIEKFLVQPMSRLIGSCQVADGDWIQVDLGDSEKELVFWCEKADMETGAMAQLAKENFGFTA